MKDAGSALFAKNSRLRKEYELNLSPSVRMFQQLVLLLLFKLQKSGLNEPFGARS